MLEKSGCWFLQLRLDHVVEDRAYSKEPLCSHTEIVQAIIVQQDLLDDEGGDSLRQISATFHDPQTERYDLGLQQEVDHRWVINLDQGANHSKRCESQVLKRSPFADCIQKWVQEQSDVGFDEKWSRVLMRSDTLEQS